MPVMKFWFSHLFYFNTVVGIVVRHYFVYLCDLKYSFAFAIFVVFFGGHIFQVLDSFCFVWFRAAYPSEMPYFLAIIAFYRFSRTVVLGCPVLFSAESTVIFLLFLLFSVLICLNFLDGFMFYLCLLLGINLFSVLICLDFLDGFLFYLCGWYSRLFVSAVIAFLCDKFYGGFQVEGFFADQFFPEFFSVILVMNFDMGKSFCLMSLNSHVFSSVISFF